MFLTLLFLGVIIYLLVKPEKSKRVNREEPLEILKRRYALGEINQEEFLRMKKDLSTY